MGVFFKNFYIIKSLFTPAEQNPSFVYFGLIGTLTESKGLGTFSTEVFHQIEDYR
jgi:hypothetical protein